MIDRFSSDAPAYDALAREKSILLGKLEDERRKTTAAEAKCNQLARENMQLIQQHKQDAADIESKKFEIQRLRNYTIILEQKLKQWTGEP